MKLFLFLIFIFVLQTNPANENDFLTLMNPNLLPREFKEFLSTGFPRGFLGEQFGMAIIAKEHLSDEPVMWYRQLWTTTDQEFLCYLARDNPFNCFLFNVMAKEFILLMRFARMGPKHLIPEAKTLTINFLYQHCRMRFVEKKISVHNSGGYCPNPCSNKTYFCQSIPNTKEGKCRINANFPYRDDGFECVCKDKYIWSVHAKVCVSNSFILTPTSLECYRNGTKTILHFNDGLHCVCKKNYYGKKCDKIINPCKSPVTDKPAGNSVCRINRGNQCISSGMFHPIADPFFHCKCNENFQRNYSFPYDNCLYELKPCEKFICMYGTCVSISTRKSGECICKSGWSGVRCDIPVPENDVSPWTQWSTCLPICGGNRVRQRLRVCLRLFCDIDKHIDVRPCRPRSCHRYHHPDSRDIFIMKVQISDDERREVDYITYILIIIVIASMILAAAFIQWRLLNPFLRIVGTHKTNIKTKNEASQKIPEVKSIK